MNGDGGMNGGMGPGGPGGPMGPGGPGGFPSQGFMGGGMGGGGGYGGVFPSPPGAFPHLPNMPPIGGHMGGSGAPGGPPLPTPSATPGYSSLYQPTQGVHLPDLLIFIRGWHQGKIGRSADGKRVNLKWFCLEVIHLDSNTQVFVHDCPDDPPGADDTVKKAMEEEIALTIQQRIEHRVRGVNSGMQRMEVRCHFRSDDGVVTLYETYTVPVTMPSQQAQWGQPHYGNDGGGSGGYGGGGFGGGGGGGFMGGGGFGGPQSTLAVNLRAQIDAQQRADAVLGRALHMYENLVTELRTSNQYYVSQDMHRMHLMATLQDQSRRNRLEEQTAELKMAALQTAMEKFLTAMPLGFVILNRWLNQKKQEKEGKITPRAEKAMNTLRALMGELEKNPMLAKDPQMLKGMLMGAGATEETVGDLFETFQEFAFDKMMIDAEVKTKQNLLGMGDPNDTNNGLKRLLAAAGVKKNVEEGVATPSEGKAA